MATALRGTFHFRPAQSLVFLVAVQLASTCTVSANREHLVKPFNETFLQFDEQGQPYANGPSTQLWKQEISGLGKMIKLDTLMSPTGFLGSIVSVEFTIRTRTKITTFIKFNRQKDIQLDLDELESSGFDPLRRRTIILIPGYLNEKEEKWVEWAASRWLNFEDVNVITVSWSSSTIYSTSVADSPLVARQVTILLHYLTSLYGIRVRNERFLSNVHIIGNSLGAHISGFVGNDLGGRVGRITGLDPAGPSFDIMPRGFRLDPTDAQLVYAIHSNAGHLSYLNAAMTAVPRITGWLAERLPGVSALYGSIRENFQVIDENFAFGIDINVGHLDFYANNGNSQPGCKDPTRICDHNRAIDIFLDLLWRDIKIKQSTDKTRPHQYPMLGFKSRNYTHFEVGRNLHEFCPDLIDEAPRPQTEASTLNGCTAPLDVTSSSEEMIELLQATYGISVSQIVQTEAEKSMPRFYFSTPSARPFATVQYLLTIKTNKLSTWNAHCQLEVVITQESGNQTFIKINGDTLLSAQEAPGQPDRLSLAIPVVLPLNDAWFHEAPSSPEARLSNADFTSALPYSLRLSTTNLKSVGSNTTTEGNEGEAKLEAVEANSRHVGEPLWKRHPYGSQQSQASQSSGGKPDPSCSLRLHSMALKVLTAEQSHMALLYDPVLDPTVDMMGIKRPYYEQLVSSGYLDEILVSPHRFINFGSVAILME